MDLMTTTALIAIFLFTIFDAFSDAFQFQEVRGKPNANKWWHVFQAWRQGTVIAGIAYLVGSWQIALAGLALFWFFHDGLVNTIGLEKPWTYVGTTAWIDKQFQKFKNPKRAMLIAKLLLLGAAAVAFFAF